jgi:hypothetical protein
MADPSISSTNPQEKGSYTASDYQLNVYVLTSDGNLFTISNIILNFNLYENIFTPYVSGDIEIGDAQDLLFNYSFNGNEYLKIVLSKPGENEPGNEPIQKYFRIYKVSNRVLKSQSLQNYTIHFCSEEAILSTQTLIRKSYKGMPVSDIIQDIVKNVLKASPDKLNGGLSKTAGNYDIIVPRMQPFEAISWLKTRAYDTDKTAYFFYENRFGYNFLSYEDLLNQTTYRTYDRSPKVDPDPSKAQNSIYHIGFAEEFDIIKGNRYGAFATSLLTFDLLSRSYNKTTLSAPQLDLQKNFLNKYPFANFSQNRFNKTLFDNEESMQKFYLTTDSDKNTNPTFPQKWLIKQAIKLAELNSRKVIINIPFDALVTAGAIVELNIPVMRPQDKKYEKDKFKSGRYLVSSVHHGITGDAASTTLELLTDSIGDQLPNAAIFSGTLQDFKSS